jgi:hypothetical protein
MPRIAMPAALLALVCSLAVAACGGSDDKPTKAEYITKADAICKAADDKIQTLAQQQFANQQPTPEQITQFQRDKVVPSIEQQSKDLRALDKPDGDDDELNGIYDSLDEAVQKAKSSPTIDDTTFQAVDKKAQDYGFKECGKTDS